MITRYLGLCASNALVGVVKHISPTKVDQGTAVVGPLHFLPSLLDAQHPSNGASWRAAHSTEGPARVHGYSIKTASRVRFSATPIGRILAVIIALQDQINNQHNISHCVKCSA